MNPIKENDFSLIFGFLFSNTKENFQNTVIQNGYTELPTINHDYAFSTVSEDLLSQAASIFLDSDRLSKEIERRYGPAQNGEYLGHIGEQPLSLIVYQKELMGIVNWEISLSINHQN